MARVQAKKTQTEEQVKAKTQPKAVKETKPQLKDQPNEAVLAMDIGTRSIIGMVGTVEDGKIAEVSYLPAYLPTDGAPYVVGPEDPMFQQINDYMARITREQGMDEGIYHVKGNGVRLA